MIEHLAHLMDRFCFPILTGAGVLGGMMLATGTQGSLLEWAERFGLPVVLLFLLIFALNKIVPPLLQWHLKHLDEMSKLFLVEIKAERESREKFAKEEQELRAKFAKEHTDALTALAGALGKRPCQIPQVIDHFKSEKIHDP